MTFDYITAWHEAAKPAYESLPQNVRDLLDRTARLTADLHQLPDTSMPWPTTENDPVGSDVSGVLGFREAFRKIPAEVLALAARTINSIGHWYPGNADGYEVPGRSSGATWKFSHYADQDLRDRLNIAQGNHGRGFGMEIHEGAIRVTYSDYDLWIWEEIGPATEQGKRSAEAFIARVQKAAVGLTKRREIGYEYGRVFDEYRERDTANRLACWPAEWLPLIDIARYMVEEDVLQQREAAKPATLAKTRADLIKRTAQNIANAERNRDGMVWFLDHGIAIDNCIYYSHRNIFSFGWRQPATAEVVSQILDVISEFPYAYEIKCADGKTLSGGVG